VVVDSVSSGVGVTVCVRVCVGVAVSVGVSVIVEDGAKVAVNSDLSLFEEAEMVATEMTRLTFLKSGSVQADDTTTPIDRRINAFLLLLNMIASRNPLVVMPTGSRISAVDWMFFPEFLPSLSPAYLEPV